MSTIHQCHIQSYIQWTDVMTFTARCYACAVQDMALCPSVCPSVTSRCSTKRTIAKRTLHDSTESLVFWGQRSPRFDRGHPLRGRQMQVGWVKIGDFRQKQVKTDTYFILKSNMKSYALYRMVALLMTLSAPKPPHFLHFAPQFIAS